MSQKKSKKETWDSVKSLIWDVNNKPLSNANLKKKSPTFEWNQLIKMFKAFKIKCSFNFGCVHVALWPPASLSSINNSTTDSIMWNKARYPAGMICMNKTLSLSNVSLTLTCFCLFSDQSQGCSKADL